MAKPFALSELEARVRALTRRGAGGGADRDPATARWRTTRSAAAPTSTSRCWTCRRANWACWKSCWRAPAAWCRKEQLVDHLCEWGEEVSATTPSKSMCTACARRSKWAACASPPCAAWATAWKNSCRRRRGRRLPLNRLTRGSGPAADADAGAPATAGSTRARRADPALAVRRNPRLDAGAAAAAVADEHRHHLPGGEVDRQPAVRPRAGRPRHGAGAAGARSRRQGRSRACPARRATSCAPTMSTMSTSRCAAPDGRAGRRRPRPAAAERGRRRACRGGACSFRNDSMHGTPSAGRLLLCQPAGAGAATRTSRAARWCRWPRRWTSAPSWPTKSSRA